MRKLIFLVACMIICDQALSQDRPQVVFAYDNIEIPIYHNSVGDEIDYRVMQDLIHEVFFGAEVLDKSPLRFKVGITTVISSTPAPVIVGWIDKSMCGVYSRYYYDENKRPYIKLYSRPDAGSDFSKVYESVPAQCGLLTVIDYAADRWLWLKVMFYLNDELYVGWVDRYCDNVYDSCEGGSSAS
ncbi:MAG: hypothetical protein J6K38_00150 [Alistipes sp.]|nr:hypothetical protein [Alistipes sp.]